MESAGRELRVRILNRFYLYKMRGRVLGKMRRKAVRRWRPEDGAGKGGPRQPTRGYGRSMLRLSLAAAVCVILILCGGWDIRIALDSLVHFRYIDQQIPVWEPSGPDGRTTVEEGIRIRMDDGAVSIFRVEEFWERDEGKEPGDGE